MNFKFGAKRIPAADTVWSTHPN